MVDFNVNFNKYEVRQNSDLGKSFSLRKSDNLKNEPLFDFAKNSKMQELENLTYPSQAASVKNTTSEVQGKSIVIAVTSPYEDIEQPYEEFCTDLDLDTSDDNTLSKWMELTGIKTKEEAIKDIKQSNQTTAAENKKKNEIMNNTRASNGMTYKEALQTYMRIYNEYLRYCQVEVPVILQTEHAQKEGIPNGEFIGGMCFDVDPSKIEEHMPSQVKEQYHQVQQALAELEKNEEFMKVAQESRSHKISQKFKRTLQYDGSALRRWQDYAARNGIDPESQMNRGIKNPFSSRWE